MTMLLQSRRTARQAARAVLMLIAMLALLALALPVLAQQPVPKYPILDADARMPVLYRDDTGTGIGWWYWTGSEWQRAGGVITYTQMTALWGNQRYQDRISDELSAWWAAADKRAAADALWAKYSTGTPCSKATDTAQVALCNAFDAHMLARKPAAPGVLWVVAPNAAYTTRPTYAWDGTARSTAAAAERVAVGAACDPAVGAVTTLSTGSYLGVLGRTDRVALCRRQ